MMVSVGLDFCPCACEVFNSETPAAGPDCTFVIVAYGCDDVGKNMVFGCNSDADFDEALAQFGSVRPTMMQD